MTYTTVQFNQVSKLGQSQPPPPLPKQPLSPEEQAHFEKALFDVMVKTAVVGTAVGLFLGVLVVAPLLE